MIKPSEPSYWPRQLFVAIAGLLCVALLFSSASVVMLRASPVSAKGRTVQADSIALTARLDRYEYDLENSRTILVTATGTARAYLVKDDQTALAGANVSFRLPAVNIEGQMTPQRPGEYAHTLTEQIRITSPIPFLETRGWQVRNLQIEIDGRDETSELAINGDSISAMNLLRKDQTKAGLDVFRDPRTYNIKTQSLISFQVLQADDRPAANLTATIELPQRNYREQISTDAEGWVRINRNDELQLSVQGGELVTIQGPIFIELPEDDSTLFWWEDPNPRCEMRLTPQQERLAVQPGMTARFGFEVRNRGNRPETYTFQVEGVPPEWVELEYESVSLYPFFGQVIYVNVTPKRAPETKKGGHTLTFTVTSSCETLNATSDLKVLEFHQSAIDIYGAEVSAGPKLSDELRRKAKRQDPNEMVSLIVRYGGRLPLEAERDITTLQGKVTRQFELIDGMMVQIPAGKVDALANLAWVSRVDPNGEVKALLDRSVPVTGAPELWKLGYDGTGVKVAVVDTGVDYNHAALKGHVILGPDFANSDADPMDGNGHGTHVAGTIASQTDGRKGVAPGSTIMAVKVLSDSGSGTESDVIAGVEWAVKNGADVINLSLGGPGGNGLDPLSQAVDNAVKSGVLVVVAAGNSGPDFSTVGSPGDARLALTVGATDNNRIVADFSSRGPTADGRPKPDLVAPGVDITSSVPGGGWDTYSGTSMSTPHVAGLGALLIQATGAEPLAIKEGLKRTALDLHQGPNISGAGFIQPLAALREIERTSVIVQQEVYPGDTAAYKYTLQNQGNVDDRFRITQWIDNNEHTFQAQPTLPHGAISSGSSFRLRSGEIIDALAMVNVPKDWAGLEDTPYRFHLQSTSMADRYAVAADRATVKVKATKRSIAEFVRLETKELQEAIEKSEMTDAAQTELLGQADRLDQKAKEAIAAIATADENRGNALLQEAFDVAVAMEYDVLSKQNRQQIPAADGQDLQQRLRKIEEHLQQARGTALRP